MTAREDVINTLSKMSDPRSERWEYRAVLDTLQEVNPCKVADLLKAVNDRYDCELFTYHPLYSILRMLSEQGVVRMDRLNKNIRINPEYVTREVRYLPVSNYCFAIFTVSAALLMLAIVLNNMVVTATMVVVVGAMYLLGQYLGSEFKLGSFLRRD